MATFDSSGSRYRFSATDVNALSAAAGAETSTTLPAESTCAPSAVTVTLT